VAEFVMMELRFLTNKGKGCCFDMQFEKKSKKKKEGENGASVGYNTFKSTYKLFDEILRWKIPSVNLNDDMSF
jgi:hypothetical protein